MGSIIKSLVLIVAIAAVAGGATYSYFSATAPSRGNTFSTGTLAIAAGGNTCVHHHKGDWDSGQQTHYSHDIDDCNRSTNIDITNAQPGTCATDTITVKNTGTLTARDISLSIAGKTGSLCDVLTINPTGSVSGTIDPSKSLDLPVTVCFPNDPTSDQSQYEHTTCTFDIDVDVKAYQPTI